MISMLPCRKGVRKAVVQLIATVAKHELASVKWPELFEFIQQYTHSNLPEQREVSCLLLDISGQLCLTGRRDASGRRKGGIITC